VPELHSDCNVGAAETNAVYFLMDGGTRIEPSAIGGGLEGADKLAREMALWMPSRQSPDRIINGVKDTADARSRDSVRNNGYVAGVANIHKNEIIGAQYRLNAQPNWRFLSVLNKGFNEDWADEFQQVVEARFNLLADSAHCWLDAERKNTLTGMMRLAVMVFLATGEVIATVEWIRESLRPYYTSLQFVRSDRLCNPNGQSDTATLRRGVRTDQRGKAVLYYIRSTDSPYMIYPGDGPLTWAEVPAIKPWGRKQVIHIIEQMDHGQTRGVSDMVSVMKSLRMTKRFSEVVLQSAVINATYAAAIESELPGEAIVAALGGPSASDPAAGMLGMYSAYLQALGSYLGGSQNIAVDGAVVPHLFPGTKMKLQNAGTPGGIGTNFEESLLRHIAAGLGVSYEGLSRDYSKTNYSSGKLATNQMSQFMAARKKHVADRLATDIYSLWLEEAMADGDIPLPARTTRDIFYAPLAKEAFCQSTWIGSGAGQVDELKETQAAGLRIQSGISTHEQECARLGYDWREILDQRSREVKAFEKAGVETNYSTIKPNGKPGGDAANAADGTDEKVAA
jgi:lambda family phage portal protein